MIHPAGHVIMLFPLEVLFLQDSSRAGPRVKMFQIQSAIYKKDDLKLKKVENIFNDDQWNWKSLYWKNWVNMETSVKE